MSKEQTVILQDAHSNTPGETAVTIKWSNKGIEIHPEGTSTYDDGGPIYIERYKGNIIVRLWADIDKQDPTHTVSLFGAREQNKGQNEDYKQYALNSIPAKFTSQWASGFKITTNCLFNPETNVVFDVEIGDILPNDDDTLVREFVTVGDLDLDESDGVKFNY